MTGVIICNKNNKDKTEVRNELHPQNHSEFFEVLGEIGEEFMTKLGGIFHMRDSSQAMNRPIPARAAHWNLHTG